MKYIAVFLILALLITCGCSSPQYTFKNVTVGGVKDIDTLFPGFITTSCYMVDSDGNVYHVRYSEDCARLSLPGRNFAITIDSERKIVDSRVIP